jgi:Mn2+/Fe2+ NRAMP family transporter
MYMADLPPYSTPRWVKIAGIIVLVLVLLLGIMLITGVGGDHGPRRHMEPVGHTVLQV